MGATKDVEHSGARHGAAGGSMVPELIISQQRTPALHAAKAAASSQQRGDGSPQGVGFFEQRRKFLPDSTLSEIVESADSLTKQHVSLPPLNLGQLNLDACRKALKAIELQRQSQLLSPGAVTTAAAAAAAAAAAPYVAAGTAAAPAARASPGPAAAAAGAASGTSGAAGHAANAPGTTASAGGLNTNSSGPMRALPSDGCKSPLLMMYGPCLERWTAVWAARSETAHVIHDAEPTGQHRLKTLPSTIGAMHAKAMRFPSCAGLNLSEPTVPYIRDPARCGVSLAFVLHFASHVATVEHDTLLTTRQVVERHILPRFPNMLARYCDTLPEPLTANPRFLVSHRWDALFSDMVTQLSRHFTGQDPELTFLYIDIFSTRLSSRRKQEPLAEGGDEGDQKAGAEQDQEQGQELQQGDAGGKAEEVKASPERKTEALGLRQKLADELGLARPSDGGQGRNMQLEAASTPTPAAPQAPPPQPEPTMASPTRMQQWRQQLQQQQQQQQQQRQQQQQQQTQLQTQQQQDQAQKALEAERERAAAFAQLQDVIGNIQQTLLILDPDAIVLTRGWVLWELFSTLNTHRHSTGCVAVLAHGVQWSFVLQELVLRVHFDSADATDRADLTYIRDQIAHTAEGTTAASRLVAQAVIRSAGRQFKYAEKLLLTNHGSPTHYLGLRVQQAIMARVEGNVPDAEKMLWGAMDYLLRGLHGEPEDLGFLVCALVDVMVISNAPEEVHRAASLCHVTQEHLDRCLGPDHPVCMRLHCSHIWALLRAGQVLASEQLGRVTLSRQEQLDRPVSELLDILFALATVQRVLGRTEEAEGYLLRAVKLGEEALGYGHPQCAVALKLLGEWCHDAGRYADAAVWLVQARAAMSRVYSRDSTSWVRATLQLSTCLAHLDDLEAAEKLLLSLLKGKDTGGKGGAAAVDGKDARALGKEDSSTDAAGLGSESSQLSVRGGAGKRRSVPGVPRKQSVPLPQLSKPQAQSALQLHLQKVMMHAGLSEANLRRDMGGLMFEVLQELLQVLVVSTKPAKHQMPSWQPPPRKQGAEEPEEEEEAEVEDGKEAEPAFMFNFGEAKRKDDGGGGLMEGEVLPTFVDQGPSGLATEEVNGTAKPSLPGATLTSAEGEVAGEDNTRRSLQSLLESGLSRSRRQSLSGDTGPEAAPALHAEPSGRRTPLSDVLTGGESSAQRLQRAPSLKLLQQSSMHLKRPDSVDLLAEELQAAGDLEGRPFGAWAAPTTPAAMPQRRVSRGGLRVSDSGVPKPPRRVSISGVVDERPPAAPAGGKREGAPPMPPSLPRPRPTSTPETANAADKVQAQDTDEEEPARTIYDVFSECIVIVTRLLSLFDEEKNKAEAPANPTDLTFKPGGGLIDPNRPGATSGPSNGRQPRSLFKQESLYRRAMTDAGTALQASEDGLFPICEPSKKLASTGGRSRSVFSARPHERKFKVRNRQLATALAPMAGSASDSTALGGTARAALLAAALRGNEPADGVSSEPELPRRSNPGTMRRSGAGTAGLAGSKPKDTSSGSGDALAALRPKPFRAPQQPLPPLLERRRNALLSLSTALQKHADMLRKGTDETGAALTSQLGLAVAHHLSGPGEPEAIASVASVIDLLVSRRRFTEAKQQLAYRLELPAMTAAARESLKGQVERYMTDAAFRAAAIGDTETLQEALALGASTIRAGKQIMVVAAANGQRDIVNMLIKHDPGLVEMSDAANSMRPLAVAVALGHRGIAEDLLIRGKAQVDAVDADGRTSLVHAALAGRVTITLMLLNAGANVDLRYLNNYTPLMAAAAKGHMRVLELMIERGAYIDAVDQHGRSALFHAVLSGHLGVTSLLLRAGCAASIPDKDSCTPLLYATRMGSLDAVAVLVAHQVDLNVPDARGMTALQLAACHGRTRIVDLLLRQRANIRAHDKEGRNSLHHAAKNGHLSICCALLVQSSTQDGTHPVSVSDPDAQTAIQIRVDQALEKAGAKLATNAEVSAAVAEVNKLASMSLACADNETCLQALEALQHTAGMLAIVRSYACTIDKTGRTAADWAEVQGLEELAAELRKFTKRREEFM